MTAALLLVAAYLLGSLSGSLLIGRLQGVDIRQLGSGNAGGTNAFRTRGWRFALGVVLIDLGKGALAVAMARWAGLQQGAVLGCLLAAVAGHVWPLFYGFRGGKGAATLVGGLAVVWPFALLPVLSVWLLCLLLTGYVGLSTVLAGLALHLAAALDPGPLPELRWSFALCAGVFLVFTHRSNLQRLHDGSEHRFEQVRLFKRWLGGSKS